MCVPPAGLGKTLTLVLRFLGECCGDSCQDLHDEDLHKIVLLWDSFGDHDLT